MERKLQRTRYDNVISGVCGGIAKYFNIDVTIVRVVWALAFFFGGIGFLPYILAAIIIPKEPINSFKDEPKMDDRDFDPEYAEYKDRKNKSVIGLLLMGFGLVMAFNILFPNFNFKFFWPLILIGGGFLLLNRKNNDETSTEDHREEYRDEYKEDYQDDYDEEEYINQYENNYQEEDYE